MKKITIKNKTFVLFLTGNKEKIIFDDVYDFELKRKQTEQDGDGFMCWVEVVHNGELLLIGLD